MEYNDAMLEVNDYLAGKATPTTARTLAELYKYREAHKFDEVRSRAVGVIIKYHERVLAGEQFSTFIAEKAKLLKKKTNDITKEDLARFRRDFDSMSINSKKRK